jgi:hypothetical protein
LQGSLAGPQTPTGIAAGGKLPALPRLPVPPLDGAGDDDGAGVGAGDGVVWVGLELGVVGVVVGVGVGVGEGDGDGLIAEPGLK